MVAVHLQVSGFYVCLPVSNSCWNMLLVSYMVAMPTAGFMKSLSVGGGGSSYGFTSIECAVALIAPGL